MIVGEIASLQKKLDNISTFYKNLESEGILVKPTVKLNPSRKVYLLEHTGSYASLYDFLFELKDKFSSIPNDAVYFVLFPDRLYSPKRDRFQIGVVATKDMKLRQDASEVVFTKLPSFKSLSYEHIGSLALISMLIMQMHKYMDKKGIKQNLSLPINELEFYKNSQLNGNKDENTVLSEINIPII